MQTVLASSLDRSEKPWIPVVLAVVLTILSFTAYNYLQQYPRENKTLKIEKSGGKNSKHANQNAKERAEQEYQKVNDELVKLRAKTPKTKEDVKQVDKLERLKKHWQKKKDWSGEHHSQKSKGN